MSTEQKSIPTEPIDPPNDDKIVTWGARQLKNYVTEHNPPNSQYAKQVAQNKVESKDLLRFMALDSRPWTIDRIANLPSKFKRHLVDKIVLIDSSLDENTFGTYINADDVPTNNEHQEVMEQMLQILTEHKENELNQSNEMQDIIANAEEFIPKIQNNDEEDADRHEEEEHRSHDEHDEMSSVSTHPSMPGLMSDDESDENDIDDDDKSSDSDLSDDDNATEIKENPLESSSNDEQVHKQKSPPKPKPSTNKPKKEDDDWGKGIARGFLMKNAKKKKQKSKNKTPPKAIKPPTKTKDKAVVKAPSLRQQLQAMGYPAQQIDHALLTLPDTATVSDVVDMIEATKEMERHAKAERLRQKQKQMEEEKKSKLGFRLFPAVDASKSAAGNMFLCISPRKEKANLKEYKYLKCWVELKHKLRKKSAKQALYYAVLVDLRHLNNEALRDLEREKLKMGYENVVSFTFNKSHGIMDVSEDNERRLKISRALKEYKQTLQLRKEDKKVAKLVTAGFDDEDARKALSMSLAENNIESIDEEIDKALAMSLAEIEKDIMKQHDDEDDEDEKEEEKQEELAITTPIAPPKPTPQDVIFNAEEEEIDDVTLELMNKCRFNRNDLALVIDDPDVDEVVNDLYVRITMGIHHGFRIFQIEKTMDYPAPYHFMDRMITKGLQVSSGTRSFNYKLSKISDDDFTAKEYKIRKNKGSLPSLLRINAIIQKRIIIRNGFALQTTQPSEPTAKATATASVPAPSIASTTTSPEYTRSPQPGAVLSSGYQSHEYTRHNHSNYRASGSGLSAQNLNKHNEEQGSYTQKELITRYLDAIQNGATCFYAIPTAQTDTQFVCFMLNSSKENKPLLKQAIQIARNVAKQKIIFDDIREGIIENDAKKKQSLKMKHDYYKSKGILINMINTKNCLEAYHLFQEMINKQVKQPDHCTNFCRLVMHEFGQSYLSMKNRIKQDKSIKHKPQGPKFEYKLFGEPSIETMSVSNTIELYGEYDHSECANSVPQTQSQSPYQSRNQSQNQSEIEYAQPGGGHPSKQRKNEFKQGDKVRYEEDESGSTYDVVVVLDSRLMIQNNYNTYYVSHKDYHKLSYV